VTIRNPKSEIRNTGPEADAPRKMPISEASIEIVIATLLRVGVIISATVVLIGGSLFLWHHGTETPAYHVFQSEPRDLRFVDGILGDVLKLDDRGIIQFGLVLLIATPVARVVFSIFAFLRDGDRKFVVIALMVLAALMYGLLGGKG
jgi:uncharacterized membrane protein